MNRTRHIRGLTARRILGAAAALAILTGAVPGSRASFASAERQVGPLPHLLVSLAGSDTGACLQAAPCASFNYAYRVARPGQIVDVAAGVYPSQRIDFDPRKRGTDDVVFQPAKGALVVLGDLEIGQGQYEVSGAKHVIIRSMDANHVLVWPGADDITLERLDARNVQVFGARNVLVRGGDYGPCVAPVDGTNCNSKVDGGGIWPLATNIVFDGVVFHDALTLDPATYHTECLILFPSINVTVRNSTFYNCDIYDILAASPLPGLVIENNWFASPNGGRPTALAFDARRGPLEDALIRFNSFNNSIVVWDDSGTGKPYKNVRFIGNIARRSCYPTVSFSENVWYEQTKCSSKDRIPSYGYFVENGRLKVDPLKAVAIRRIFAAAAARRTLKQIVRTIVRSRAPRPSGSRWHIRSVRAILSDKAYLGNRFGPKGAHPAIVTVGRWRAAQRAVSR